MSGGEDRIYKINRIKISIHGFNAEWQSSREFFCVCDATTVKGGF